MMPQDNRQKLSQALTLMQSMGSQPLFSHLKNSQTLRLVELADNINIETYLFKQLQKQIASEEEVVLRLKWWFVVHSMLTRSVADRNAYNMVDFISSQQERLRAKCGSKRGGDCCLEESVELPYLNFLRRLSVWSTINMEETDSIDQGFSLHNKLNQLLKLKPIFQHYSCYYSQHHYALNLYEACLGTIKVFWRDVCMTVKWLTQECKKSQHITRQEFLFMSQSEALQEKIIEFVYDGHFCSQAEKFLVVKQIRLIKDEIKELDADRRKEKEAEELTRDQILTKRSRKASFQKDSGREYKQTKGSESQNLNTQEQLQILDTIKELQALLTQ